MCGARLGSHDSLGSGAHPRFLYAGHEISKGVRRRTDVAAWDSGGADILRRKDRHDEYSALLHGHLPVVAFPTVGELLTGAEKAGWQERSLDELHRAIAAAVILRSTDEVIEEYSHLHWRFSEELGKKGHNDMWIAAWVLAQPAHRL